MLNVGWYFRRLRVMSRREMAYRIGKIFSQVSLFGQFRLGRGVTLSLHEASKFQFCTSEKALLPPLNYDLAGLRQAAPMLLRGELPLAGGSWRWNASDSDTWHRAPDTKSIWPKDFFGLIPYREGNPYGDIRLLWEPARLQHLVDLAMLARIGSTEEQTLALNLVKAELASWVAANPPLAGPHYVSAMECALRLIAVCHALDLLREQLGNDSVWENLAELISSHVPLIERRLSLYSSTGNHTVAEAAGLVYAGLLFPELAGSNRRYLKGLNLLKCLADSQVLPDGGGAEQSHSYHVFNVQLLRLVSALLKAQDIEVPDIDSAVRRGANFFCTFRKFLGAQPPIGDSDAGHALSRFLRIDDDQDDGLAVHARQYEHAGYTAVHWSQAPTAGFVFDHGPLGMPPSFGHGHADALSLLLNVQGVPVLVDPGTYTYTGDHKWRRYFRGTRAHNTITVDGRDQADQTGSFLWSNPYNSRLLAVDIGADGGARGRLLADHDGYRELGIRHTRGLAWSPAHWLVIWDHITGPGEINMELNWHLGVMPRQLNDQAFELSTDSFSLLMRCQGGSASIHCGEQTPLRGWRSPHYGELTSGHDISVHHHGPLPHSFTTLIDFREINEPCNKEIEAALGWMQENIRES